MARPRVNVSCSRLITARAHAQTLTAVYVEKRAAGRTSRLVHCSNMHKTTQDSAATRDGYQRQVLQARENERAGGVLRSAGDSVG